MKGKLIQNSFRGILALFLILSFLLTTHPAMAGDQTITMKFLKGFGEDHSNGLNYKILVQSSETGNQYFVWYYHSLNLVEGQNVVITVDRWDDWKTVSNLRNGKEQGGTQSGEGELDKGRRVRYSIRHPFFA